MQTENLYPCSPIQWSFNMAPFSTPLSFFLSSALPLFPVLAHISRCRFLPGLRSPLAAHLPLIWHHVSPCLQATKRGRNGSSLCIRDWLLQLSVATLLGCGGLVVTPEVTLLCGKVRTVWSCERPVVKKSRKMDSSVHPKLLNSIRILVSSVLPS